tara:strand:- start:46 stop:633 length:588 start_codon:yes stop_codon:yes gene_type:complete
MLEEIDYIRIARYNALITKLNRLEFDFSRMLTAETSKILPMTMDFLSVSGELQKCNFNGVRINISIIEDLLSDIKIRDKDIKQLVKFINTNTIHKSLFEFLNGIYYVYKSLIKENKMKTRRYSQLWACMAGVNGEWLTRSIKTQTCLDNLAFITYPNNTKIFIEGLKIFILKELKQLKEEIIKEKEQKQKQKQEK